MQKKDKSYFNAAKSVSKLSDHEFQIGCVIVSGHRIISSGCSHASKFSSQQAKMDSEYFDTDNCLGQVHAEFEALRPFLRKHEKLPYAELYLYREHKDGSVAKSRPCPRCMQILKDCGIKKINYTTNEGFAKEIITEKSLGN